MIDSRRPMSGVIFESAWIYHQTVTSYGQTKRDQLLSK